MMVTERLIAKPLVAKDYEILHVLYSKMENMQYILDGKYTYTLQEIKDKYSQIGFNEKSHLGFLGLFLKETNQLIGECGLLPCDNTKTVEIAYMLDTEYRGQGFAVEITQALLSFAFNELKVEKVVAGMYADNVASIHLVEKLGFQLSKEHTTTFGILVKDFFIVQNKMKAI